MQGGQILNAGQSLVEAALLLPSPAGARRVPVGDRPIYIGSAEHCQIRAPIADDQIPLEAVVWQRDGELLLRSLKHRVEIAGREWSWAILEHGDQFRCGGLVITVALSRGDEVSMPPGVEQERRRVYRLRVDTPGRILGEVAGLASGTEVRVVNIGDGGGLIHLRYRPLVGQPLQLAFRPPPDNAEVVVSLAVIATSETGDPAFPFAAHCRQARGDQVGG